MPSLRDRRDRLEKRHQEGPVQNELTFRQMIDGISALVAIQTPDGELEFVNRQVLDYFGRTLEELKGWTSTDAVHPDDLPGLIAVWRRSVESGQPFESEHRQRGADAVYRWFHVQGLPVRDAEGRIVCWCNLQTDIEDRKRAEGLLAGQNLVLEMTAKGNSLETILEALCRVVEQTAAGCRCSVVLIDPGGAKIQRSVAPSLPSSYNDRFTGTPVDREGGPGAEAARRKTQVIVADVASDTQWDTYGWRTAALTHGLKACWSTPILASNDSVLGTFAIYWREPRSPTEQDHNIIEQMTHLAAVAIERARNEAALTTAFEDAAKSEAELRTIIDAIPQLIIAIGADGRFLSANQAVLDYTGLTKEEVKTESFRDVFHPEDSERLRDQRELAISRGVPFEYERRVRRKDGQYRWLLVLYNPLLGERGQVIRWYATGTDIDDRKRAEDALRSNEESLRLIVDGIPGFVSTANAAGEVELVNRQVLEYFGKTIEELQNWAATDAHHPDDLPRVIDAYRRSIETGEPLDVETRNRRADGVFRWFHVRGRPQRDAEGRIVRWYHLVTDIDDRKRAEEALRQSERHLELLVETIPALVSRMTADGTLDYVNKRVLDYLGLEVGQLGFHLVHPDDRHARRRKWRHALKTGEPWEDTFRMRRADGEYRWFYDRSEPLLDRDGHVVCWYSVGFDINDSREMEEILRTTRRKLSTAMQVATVAELSASIAHEINQPLASVVTNAHACQTWLLHDPPNLERAQATLERIIRDGHSAAEVVRRIRALFKEAAPVKAPLEMNQIVAEVLRVLSDELRDNTIIVETDLEADLPMIEADYVQIQQTLINLVHNAIEAMAGVADGEKTLILSSRRQGVELLIEVRDHGVGIKDPTLVFEPFFTTKESGMGMGLSISRSIVEAHGGRIWATANEDAGMTFSVALPLTADDPA